MLVLSVLADGPMHGYAIQQQLKISLGQTLPVGSLYPLLHRLNQAWVASSESNHRGRTRKTYHLTEAGQKHLRRAQPDWQATIAQLSRWSCPLFDASQQVKIYNGLNLSTHRASIPAEHLPAGCRHAAYFPVRPARPALLHRL